MRYYYLLETSGRFTIYKWKIPDVSKCECYGITIKPCNVIMVSASANSSCSIQYYLDGGADNVNVLAQSFLNI